MHHCAPTAVCLTVALITFASSGGGEPTGKGRQGEAIKAEAIKKDLKQLEGTWEVVFVGRLGKQAPLVNKFGVGGKPKTILPDGSVLLEGKSKDAPRVKYRLDPTASPKTIDIVFPPNQKGIQVVTEGIYSIIGDELKVCCASVGHPRPTDFTYERGQFLEVYRRVKDKK